MNTSYNYADFISMCLDSDDDYEPYGYAMEALQSYEMSETPSHDEHLDSVLFGPANPLFK